jgi:oligo-1,6-glucosidase
MTNTWLPTIDEYRDIETLRHYAAAVAIGADPADVLASIQPASRDNARTPMHWDASPHAGFTSGEPWIGVNPNHTEINAAAAVADDDSVFHHYRRVIALRRAEPVIAAGDYTPQLRDDPDVYAYLRRLDDVELLVVANLSSHDVVAPIEQAQQWTDAEMLIGNIGDPAAPTADGIELRPWEAVAWRRARVR